MSNLIDSIFSIIEEAEDSKGSNGLEAVVKALEKALKNTTVDRPGCPWDRKKPDGG